MIEAVADVATQYRLYLGDCLEIMRDIPDGSVDCVVTDPPYGHTEKGSLQQRREAVLGWRDGVGIYRDETHHSELLANDGHEANDLFRNSLPEMHRILKPGCCCCCCCGGGGGPDPQFARWSLWLDEVFDFKQMVVWDKGPMGMGWHYRRSYETVLVAQKQGAACRWYDDTNRVENIIRAGTYPKIIPSSDQHPTEKPVGLMVHFIRLHTQPGDVVIDPFMGSGTTGVAAIQEGRRFIGIEIDPKYYAIAERRIADAAAQMRLF